MRPVDSTIPRVNLRETTPLADLLEDWNARDLAYLFDGAGHFHVPEAWGSASERLALEEVINQALEDDGPSLLGESQEERVWRQANAVPYTLASLLAGTASKDGELHPERLSDDFGGVLAQLMDSMRRTDVVEIPSSQPRLGLIDGRIRPGDVWWKSRRGRIHFGSAWKTVSADPSAYNEYAAQAHLTPRHGMPVLGALVALRGRSDQFDGVSVLAMQHLLGTTEVMFAKLAELGLDPTGTLVVGKGYSTHWGTQQALVRRGFRAATAMLSHGLPGESKWSPSKTTHGNGESADGKQLALSWARLGTRAKGFHTQLIIDSGANWSLMAPTDPQMRRVAVEQTTDGIRKIEKQTPLEIPIIDVARSPLKRHLEGPIIGWSVAEEIERVVADLKEHGVERGNRVTLIGYGTVGRHTAAALLMLGYDVKVVDTSDEALARAQLDAEAWRALPGKLELGGPIKEAVAGADYIVGCTGHSIFAEDPSIWFELKNGAVLFSASSSTQELAASDEAPVKPAAPSGELGYEIFQGKRIRVGHPLWDMHWHRKLEVDGKEILLANSGYPINFTGEEDPIRPELIQLTRSLMLLAAMQAVDLPPDAKGIIPLDASGQKLIADIYMKRLRAAGDKLVPKPIMDLLEEGHRLALAELNGALAT